MDGSLLLMRRLVPACCDDDSLIRSNDTDANHHATDDANDVSRGFGELVEDKLNIVAVGEVKLPCREVCNDSLRVAEGDRIDIDDLETIKRIVAVTCRQNCR